MLYEVRVVGLGGAEIEREGREYDRKLAGIGRMIRE
jgi:hypothetical protein